MLRKRRTTAVPVEQQDLSPVFTREATDQRATEEHGKTDAEQMTDIINEIKEEQKEPETVDAKEAVQEVPVVAKAKAKRASRAKAKEEPTEEPILTLKVADQREEEPKEEPAPDEKVACSDCGKQMSAKTLKYSHAPNCNGKKQKQGDEEYAKTSRAAKQVVQEIGGEHEANTLDAIAMLDSLNKIPDHAIKHFIQARTRPVRATRRETMMHKLVQTAF